MASAWQVLINAENRKKAQDLVALVHQVGHQPIPTWEYDQALRVLQSQPVDIALMTPTSLESDVWRLTASLRDFPKVAILATLPCDTYHEMATKAIKQGVHHCILAPVTPELLQAGLQQAQDAVKAIRSTPNILQAKGRLSSLLSGSTNPVSSNLNSDRVLSEILLITAQLLNAETASVLLRNQETKNLYFLATTKGGPTLAGLEVPTGRGIASWSVEHCEAVSVNDVSQDPRFYPGIDELSGYKTRNLVAAPLCIQEEAIGAIEVVNKRKGDFDQTDVTLLRAIAMPAAVAIQNALLYRDLQDSWDLLEAVLTAAASGMAAVDQAGGLLFHNPAAEELFSLTPQVCEEANVAQLVERYADQLEVVEPSNQSWQDYRKAILSAVDEKAFILRLKGKPTRILTASVKPVRYGNHPLIRLLSWRDITNEKQIEQWRQDLTHIIVHDLRNPLSLIRVGVEASEMFLPEDTSADVKQGLKLALQGVAQLERKTNVLLAVNELEIGRRLIDTQLVSLTRVAESVRNFYAFEAEERDVTIMLEMAQDLPQISGDREMIEWCIGNLTQFAIKHSSRPDRIVLTATPEKDGVLITIQNQRGNIQPKLAEHLFEKFASPTEEPEPTDTPGIGLYFCKLAIQAHQGYLDLDVGREKGYTFYVWLPVSS
jgi:PAS domain S-box-containing protein